MVTVTPIEPPATLTWEPPSEPRMAYQTAEPCPGCGAALLAEPRGIWRVCAPCGGLVTPSGVTAPYAAGTALQRQVKSKRERDTEARALEARRQRLADELDGLAADKRLTSEARGALKWYRTEVDKAKTMSRLDDLVDQFRGERLTRTGWLARPGAAEIEPADYDDDQADDWDDDEEDDGAPLAIAAPARPLDLAAELAVRGYTVNTNVWAGGCQIIEQHTGPCCLPGTQAIAGIRLCDGHRHALTTPLRRRSS